jgi:hypothetical protein
MKRKMTVLETPPVPLTPTADENNPIQKLNDDLIRITTNFINDQFFPTNFPETIFICLPREVRRHHLNQSWLADEKFLYQIRSFDFTELNRAKEILTEFNCDVDDSMKNRHRRFTDGNKKPVQIRRADRSTLVTCQDDLHIRTFGEKISTKIFIEFVGFFSSRRFRYESIVVQRTKSLDPGDSSINNEYKNVFCD